MNKLIEYFIESVNVGDVWAGFIILAIGYILKKEPFKIFAYFSDKKSKDIEQAVTFLESEKLTKEANELIREYIENYTFKKYYGINANKEMRLALLKFYKKNSKNIDWYDLKIAYHLYELDGSKVKVVLNWKNHLGRWATTIMSHLIGLYALSIIIIAFLNHYENDLKFIVLTSVSLVLWVAALLFSSINWSYYSAKKIDKCNE